jgi:hypothetical protein
MAPKVATKPAAKRKAPAKKADTKKVEAAPGRSLRTPSTRARINNAAKEKDAFHEAFNTPPPELPPRNKVAKKAPAPSTTKVTKPSVKKPTKTPAAKKPTKTPAKRPIQPLGAYAGSFVNNHVSPKISAAYKYSLDYQYHPQPFPLSDWTSDLLSKAAIQFKRQRKWDGDWKKLLLYRFNAGEIAYITGDEDYRAAMSGWTVYREFYKDWPDEDTSESCPSGHATDVDDNDDDDDDDYDEVEREREASG